MKMTVSSPPNPSPAQARYSTGAVLLHWMVALAILFELTLGFAMPDGQPGFALIQLHKSVGILILILSVARVAWRVTHRPPRALEGGFAGFVAKSAHTLLYVFMIVQPLTGWALVSTAPVRISTMLFGTIPWPHLPLPRALNAVMEQGHEILGWTGAALIVLHVAGALRHQFVLRDGLLGRMGPSGSAGMAGVLVLTALTISIPVVMGLAAAAPKTSAAAPPKTDDSAQSAMPDENVGATEQFTEATSEDAAAPPSWSIRPGGKLGFVLVGSSETYRGTFSRWTGEIVMDPDKPETADIRITVNLASASLGDSSMDATLQEPDFFAVSTSPTATWQSTSVTMSSPGHYTAKGKLSLKGVTSAQSLDFSLSGKDTRRHVEGTASIDRSTFNVGTGETAQGLSDPVSLSFSFDAVQREH